MVITMIRRSETVSIEERAASRAQNGAVFLDGQLPGWHHLIDPHLLDMAGATSHVLDFLYGSYREGITELKLSDLWQSIEYGFLSDTIALDQIDYGYLGRYYAALNLAWRNEIKRRVRGSRG